MRYGTGHPGYLTGVDLDEVAGRLYALPLSEFTAARTAEARAAKEAGQAALAREIGKLRKPTVSAWAVNRAAREHPGELGELLALGEELREAWAAQDSSALAELIRRRAEVTGRVSRLIRQEYELSAAAAAEVDQTLEAAVVDAGAADQVRRGCLVKPLSYSGFAPAPAPATGGKKAARRAEVKEGEAAGQAGRRAEGGTADEARAEAAGRGGPRGEVESAEERARAEGGGGRSGRRTKAEAAKERKEAEAARRAEDEARRARERAEAEERKAQERAEAEAAHREWSAVLAEAEQEHDERAERVSRLEKKLAKARKRLEAAARRLEVARREERHARARLND